MQKESSSSSFAGTWGSSQRLLVDLPGGYSTGRPQAREAANRFLSESSAVFNLNEALKQQQIKENKFNKFRVMQRSGTSVIGTSQQRAGGEEEDEVVDVDYPGSASRKSLSPSLSTTFRDSYRPPHTQQNGAHVIEMDLDLSRTNSKMLHSPEAPAALGRSGKRKERGVATSGLSGERLMTSAEPRYNSECQRAWLYTKDPALEIKQKGRPSVQMTAELAQLSLQLGEREYAPRNNNHLNNPPEHYGRRMVMTGDVLTKTGYARSSVFLDDRDEVVVNAFSRTAAGHHSR
eukprot:gene9080-10022_t